MLRRLSATHESWPLATPFRIARGLRTTIDVVVVAISEGGITGHGEGSVTPRYGESIDSMLSQVRMIAGAIESGLDREALLRLMPPGSARNAVDSALWDLSAQLSGRSVNEQLGQSPVPPIRSALTVGIDTPDAMFAAAAQLSDAPLVKVKVDGSDPAAQIRAVRAGAPASQLIVDANESWDLKLLDALQPVLVDARVALLEQPLPAKEDELLAGFRAAVPLCADESCHVASDLPRLLHRYQAVNIKLDKTGGLSAALELLQRARAEGLTIMCGCMIATSLGIAPAFHVARHAAFADLDGPWWLRRDRTGGITVEGGVIHPPAGSLWGAPRAAASSIRPAAMPS